MVTIYGSQRDHGRKEYCKMKKISIQNIAQLSSWIQLLVTNSLAVQQNALAKLLSSKAKLTHWSVWKFHQTHTHSTLDVKSSLKQMDAWIVSTKNTVSNNQPHHLYTVKRKQLRFGVVFFVSFIFSSFIFFIAYNNPNFYFYFYFRNKSPIKQKKACHTS